MILCDHLAAARDATRRPVSKNLGEAVQVAAEHMCFSSDIEAPKGEQYRLKGYAKTLIGAKRWTSGGTESDSARRSSSRQAPGHEPAQQLAGRGTRQAVDHHKVREALVRSDPLRQPGAHRAGIELAGGDDVRDWYLAMPVVAPPDHGRIGDTRVSQQKCLQLGRRDLVSIYFNQFLEPLYDDDIPAGVELPQIAGVQPTGFVENLGGLLRPVEIAVHDLGPTYPQLALLARGQRPASLRVDHGQFGVGEETTDGPGWARVASIRNTHAAGRLRQPPPLRDDASGQSRGEFPMDRLGKGRSTDSDQLQ